MLNLSENDRKRLAFFRMTGHKPESVIFALNEIKRQADEALKATLDSASKQAIVEFKKIVENFEKKYKKLLDNKWGKIEEVIVKAAKDKTEEMKPTDDALRALITPIVEEMIVALRPSEEELRLIIEPLIPEAENGADGKDGKTPEKEEIIEILKPILAEHISAFFPTPQDEEEAKKTAADRLYGMIVKAVAEEIGKVKGFYGGGSAGDQVKAGTGVTITQNVLGQKVINVSSTSTFATPTGTVNGTNDTFIVTAQPVYVVSDGITYFEGAGYSFNSGSNQITMDIPPSQYIKYVL